MDNMEYDIAFTKKTTSFHFFKTCCLNDNFF